MSEHPYRRDKTLTFEGEGFLPNGQLSRILNNVDDTQFIRNLTLVQQNDRYRLTVTFTINAHEGQFEGRELP